MTRKTKICIIDYGINNLNSISKALDKLSFEYDIINEACDLSGYSHIVLPGVGSFQEGAKRLRESNLKKQIVSAVSNGSNILGICLGMQLLFGESAEFSLEGDEKGLELIKGKCIQLNTDIPNKVFVPHIGWNEISIKSHGELLRGLNSGDEFYFIHSFIVLPNNEEIFSSICLHGIEFRATVEKRNIFGCQFHPEKSFNKGFKILKNFLDIN
jgi:glutamine amidotransferase